MERERRGSENRTKEIHYRVPRTKNTFRSSTSLGEKSVKILRTHQKEHAHFKNIIRTRQPQLCLGFAGAVGGGLAHGAALDHSVVTFLALLGGAFLDQVVVFQGFGFCLLTAGLLGGSPFALALQAFRGDETLDFGGFGVFLVALDNLTTDDEFADIVFLLQVKELADLGGAFGAQATWFLVISQARNVLFALLDNNQVQHGQITGNDAAADGLASALTLATSTVAGHAVSEQQADALRSEDTLFHGEALFVVTTGDAEDVAFEVIAQCNTSINFVGDTLLIEVAQFAFVIHLDDFLHTRCWV